ncbi:MAG: YchJ family metal-binding protein [Myxococcota bacterium]|nr:YchJ family metal-binding protein [Myxococcota bacterium]
MKCPCGTGLLYFVCCGRFVEGDELPTTAEQLMRSRYTAFTKRRWTYVSQTQTEPFDGTGDESVSWTNLKIHSTEGGGENDSEGWVTFTASFEQAGSTREMTEKSYFLRTGSRWLYEPAKSLTGLPKAFIVG